MSVITVGIDLAKSVFAVHGVDDSGKTALVKPKVSREHLLPLFAQLWPCLIGMEACSGSSNRAAIAAIVAAIGDRPRAAIGAAIAAIGDRPRITRMPARISTSELKGLAHLFDLIENPNPFLS